ncbi:hypothetical protein GUJ93_ZPchr0006g45609 [Zizania palustris]|uniref:Uncharacterized protein n=1 Tax=Zizania palustris TaxID=103762 RepID=A0A8J5T8E0_ZIZPA|nr:hypothetical protein GUJ93_ZPchr0006g45609 [Zizania palustris]
MLPADGGHGAVDSPGAGPEREKIARLVEERGPGSVAGAWRRLEAESEREVSQPVMDPGRFPLSGLPLDSRHVWGHHVRCANLKAQGRRGAASSTPHGGAAAPGPSTETGRRRGGRAGGREAEAGKEGDRESRRGQDARRGRGAECGVRGGGRRGCGVRGRRAAGPCTRFRLVGPVVSLNGP